MRPMSITDLKNFLHPDRGMKPMELCSKPGWWRQMLIASVPTRRCGQKIIGTCQGINTRRWWQTGIKMHEGLWHLWMQKQKLCERNWGIPWRRLLSGLGEVLANYGTTQEGEAGPCLGRYSSQKDLQWHVAMLKDLDSVGLSLLTCLFNVTWRSAAIS